MNRCSDNILNTFLTPLQIHLPLDDGQAMMQPGSNYDVAATRA